MADDQHAQRIGTRNILERFEKGLLVLGVLLLSFYVAARFNGGIHSRADLKRFWQAREAQSNAGPSTLSRQDSVGPDFRLWSEKRIAAYKLSLTSMARPPLAVLRIPRMNMQAPVLEGTDDFTLNRAVGHIEGTAEPGQNGNVGIAGHRDGFFRGLKDIQVGDAVDVITQTSTNHYLVDEILIVSPEDVSVLRGRSRASLTLVTCYPFYFVGSAPKRFIIHAYMTNSAEDQNPPQEASSANTGGGEQNR